MKARLPFRSRFRGQHQKEAKGSQQPSGGWHAPISLGMHPSQASPWALSGAWGGVSLSNSHPVCSHSPSRPEQEVGAQDGAKQGEGGTSAGLATSTHVLWCGCSMSHIRGRWMCLTPSLPFCFRRYRVVVPYPPQSEAEIELKEGDIVFVHKKREDGWYKGTLQRNGRTGLFPGSFVESF